MVITDQAHQTIPALPPMTTPHSPRGHRTRRAAAAASIAGLGLLLAACGGASSNAASPTTRAGAGTGSATASSPPPADPNVAEAKDPGDIPDTQAFVTYSPPSGGFQVKVPEGWARSEAAGVVTFTDKFNSIRMESKPVAAAPTVASVRADELPGLQQTEKGFKLGSISSVNRKAGPAVQVLYEADGAPNTVTGKSVRVSVERYEFWKNGTVAVLTLSGAKGADNVDPWKTVTDGFAWK